MLVFHYIIIIKKRFKTLEFKFKLKYQKTKTDEI